MIWLFTVDGAAFLLIGLVVLATPSPVPALMDPPDERRALVPFKDTRRLLASQFIGGGALSLALALGSPDSALQRSAAQRSPGWRRFSSCSPSTRLNFLAGTGSARPSTSSSPLWALSPSATR
jgi:hypothetical protein